LLHSLRTAIRAGRLAAWAGVFLAARRGADAVA
jgi:hypothetical protein